MTAGQLAILLATVDPMAPIVLELTDQQGATVTTDAVQVEGVWGNRVTLAASVIGVDVDW